MSRYFDKLNLEVHDLSRNAASDEQFLLGLVAIEEKLIKTLELFTGDIEVNQNEALCKSIWQVIAENRVHYQGGDFLGADNVPCHATRLAMVSKSSRLIHEMHSLWHDIVAQRLTFRFGLVLDNPEAAVKARDAFVQKKR